MTHSPHRIERQIDLGREEVTRQWQGAEPHLPHRTSSFDLLQPPNGRKDVHDHEPSSDSSTLDVDVDDSMLDGARSPLLSPRERASREQTPSPSGSSPNLTPEEHAKRRKAILARFGLRNAFKAGGGGGGAGGAGSRGQRGDGGGGGGGMGNAAGFTSGDDSEAAFLSDRASGDENGHGGIRRRRSFTSGNGHGNGSGDGSSGMARRRSARAAAALKGLQEAEDADLTSSDDEYVRGR